MIRLLRQAAERWGLCADRCPVCSVLMDDKEPLCLHCTDALRPHRGGHCPTCGAMFGSEDDPPMQCGECRLDPPPWDRLIFHGRYTGELREAIITYKYNGGLHRTRLLSRLACESFRRASDRLPDLVVPVPLHTRRLLGRGFNQSTELARELGKCLDRPLCNRGLIRIRNTVPQTRLGLAERRTNIKGAFRADPGLVQGKVILLVDDVYTTGATLTECARTLRRAGASGVDVLVLARAQEEPA